MGSLFQQKISNIHPTPSYQWDLEEARSHPKADIYPYHERREGNLQRENDHLLSHLNLNRTNVHLRSLRRWLKGKLPVYYHTSVKRIASISRRPLIWISNAVCSRVNIFFALLGQFYKTLSWKMMMIQKGVQSCAFVMSSKSHHTTAADFYIMPTFRKPLARAKW